MLTPRIFVGAEELLPHPGADYALAAAASRHVALALRMRAGDAVALFTGTGGEYAATIERIDRQGVVVRVDRHDAVEREAPLAVTLAQGVIASDMMDFVVRKAVELGVAAIVPVQAARSQHLPVNRASGRVAHWRQIAIAACEQCGRNRIPDVLPVTPFADWLARVDIAANPAAMLDADAPRSLAESARVAAPHTVAIGPEGGFAPEELRDAAKRGFAAVHLGPRVLRAETAAVAALSTINAIAGDAR